MEDYIELIGGPLDGLKIFVVGKDDEEIRPEDMPPNVYLQDDNGKGFLYQRSSCPYKFVYEGKKRLP